MTLQEFAWQLVRDYPEVEEAYIAVIGNINDDGSKTYHLEVEIEPSAVIGGVFDTGVLCLLNDELTIAMAQGSADELQTHLENLGWYVYTDSDEWEASTWLSDDEEDEEDETCENK